MKKIKAEEYMTWEKALTDLRIDAGHHLDDHVEYLNKRLDVIETALKEKEQTDMLLEQFGLSNIQNFIDNLKIVAREQKPLKAFEIIKEKKVNVAYLKYHFEKGNGGYREYVRTMNEPYLDYYPSSKTLTKEEFYLLKEVLL